MLRQPATRRLRILVAQNVTQEVPLSVRSSISNELARHFESREITNDLEAWEATIVEFQSSPTLSILKVELQGTYHHLPYTLRARAKRFPARMAFAGGGAAVVGEVVSLAVVAAAQGALSIGGAPAHLEQCVAEVTAELCQQIDSLIKHEESRSSRFWTRVLLGRWIGVLVVAVGLSIFGFALRGWEGALAAPLLPGLFIFIPLFIQIHCLGLVVLPAQFFAVDPRGRKALARSGVSNVLLMKLICLIISGVMILPELLAGLLIHELWQKARP